MRTSAAVRTCFLLCALSGCVEPEADRPPGPTYSVRDSAGIEIVENHFPAWSESEAWKVAKRPDVRIGSRNGPEEYVFGNLTPSSVGRLADGRVFAGDDQASTIRVYSPEGEYLGSAGRAGQGPGELTAFWTVSAYRGDSIWVYEYHGQTAVTIFAPDLSFAREFSNPITDGTYWVQASLDDGRFLLNTPGGDLRPETMGIVRDSSFVVVASADGLTTDTIGSFGVRTRRGNAAGDVPDSQSRDPFLFPEGRMTGRGDRIVWAEGTHLEYVEADAEGRIRRIVRGRHDPIPVTGEVIDEFAEAFLEGLGENPRGPFGLDWYERRVKEGVYPDHLPALSPWSSPKIDPFGNVWIPRLTAPFFGPAHAWDVFDPAGIWLGTLETPSDLEVEDIGVDQITGVATDRFDVQYVQVHKLDRG